MQLPKDSSIKNPKKGSHIVEYTPTRYGTIQFYPDELTDDKDWERFIKKAESITRRSIELKSFIQYLKDELDMDSCLFFKNINNTDVDVEIHHYPFSMYDICEIVARKKIFSKESFSSFEIANEVVKIHYEKLIGLVPLSKTLHQLAHSGRLFIPIQTIFGDIKEFITRYKSFILKDLIQKIKVILEVEPEEIVRINKMVLDEKIIFNSRIENNYTKEITKLIENKTKEKK